MFAIIQTEQKFKRFRTVAEARNNREEIKMTTAMAIRSAFEFLAIVLLFVGFRYEKKLIILEERAAKAIKRSIRKKLLKAGKAPVKVVSAPVQKVVPMEKPREFRNYRIA